MDADTAVAIDRLRERMNDVLSARFCVVNKDDLRSLITAYESQAERLREVEGALGNLHREADQLVNTLALATDRTTRGLYDLDSIAAHAERKLAPTLKAARSALTQSPPATDSTDV